MDLRPADLVGGFYKDDSLPWTAQDTLNWIPEAAEAQGTRTPTMLRQAPGLRPYVQVGEGPIRGIRNVEGKLLVVSGNTLYQVTTAGVAIPRGTIPGVGPVSMSHNQRGTTNQLLIVNGAAGYVYDTSALTLTKITDPGYPGAFVVDFVDGYLAQIEPRRRYWFHSALRDALEYNTLDRYEAEGQPDTIVTLLVDHREVWVFGERTIEPYVNTGALTNTFQRAANTVIDVGCSAKFSPAKMDNSVFWLDGLGIVRQSQGYTAIRISTGPIERAIAGLDWSRAFGFTMTEKGHAIYYLTFPDGQTFGYDIVTGLWHRRASYGKDRWRVSCVAYWQDQYVAGDYQQGLLYVVDWDYPHDGVLPNVRKRVTGVTHNNQNKVLIPYAEVIAQTGEKIVPAVSAPAQPDGPSITGDAPAGFVGAEYSYAYTVSGGTAPLVVSLRSGSLPAGLTLSSSGVISGTPTADTAGASFTVRVTDLLGLYSDLVDGIDVTTVPLPSLVTTAKSYSGTAAALGELSPLIDWATGTNVTEVSPNGLYAVGVNRDGLSSSFRFKKFNPLTLAWDALSSPVDLPSPAILAMKWSPDSTVLAMTLNGSPNVATFVRSGDTLTRQPNPATLPAVNGGRSIVFDSTGQRLAVSMSITSQSICVYDHAAGILTNQRVLSGVGTNSVGGPPLGMAFLPGAASRYLIGGSPTHTYVVDVSLSPMPVVCSAAVISGSGAFWSASTNYAVSIGNEPGNIPTINVLTFTPTPGSEAISLTSSLAIAASGTNTGGAALSLDRKYAAVGRISALNFPILVNIGTASPPVPSVLASLPDSGGAVKAVSWAERGNV